VPKPKVTRYLIQAEDIPAYAKVRSRFLGEVRPGFLVEIEITAAKA
jgi:hypothetical protein